jgi:predicted PurR-regulated permease PerM
MAGTVVAVVVVAFLVWAKLVLVPFTLAIFLSFLLNPLVMVLQRRGLRRSTAVPIVVLLAAVVLVGVAWAVGREVNSTLDELPKYKGNIKNRVQSVREMMGRGATEGPLGQMVREISGEPAEETPAPPADPSAQKKTSSGWIDVTDLLGRLQSLFSGGALALFLAIFMLLQREELRNRIIWLIGHERMAETTKAMDDAGERISRYLLLQTLVNVSYGLILSLGLALLGVDHALLWGFLAAVLRFVPYLGGWIAAIPPLLLSLAIFPGWGRPLMVLIFVVVLETSTNNVLAPWLYGRSLGVPGIVLLLAAAFWSFLWGPIGLVLSAPFTVCMVVLGRYVPQLSFLDVLLGDRPALPPHLAFYQRLMALDADEATRIAVGHQERADDREQVYDELLVPALSYARRDRQRKSLTAEDEQLILQATREIAEDLSERMEQDRQEPPAIDGQKARLLVIGCPASDEMDEQALELLRHLLDSTRWEMEITPAAMLTAELIARVEERQPALLCIGSLPPGGLAHTRYLCKRLRTRFPNVKIVVGRWGLRELVAEDLEPLKQAGADAVTTTLLETRANLNAWLPVLSSAPEGATP